MLLEKLATLDDLDESSLPEMRTSHSEIASSHPEIASDGIDASSKLPDPAPLPPPSQSQLPAQPSSHAPSGSFTQRLSKLTPASPSSDLSPRYASLQLYYVV